MGADSRMKIPIIKAAPRMILELLKCVAENEGNVLDMKNCIHTYLQTLSGKDRPRNIRSDVYGVTLPSLRKMDLVIGHGHFLQLSSNGRLLLRSYSSGGFDEFKYQFGRIIYEIDVRKCLVIPSLLEISGSKEHNAVKYGQLVSKLREKGIGTHEKDERLRKWLPFLRYVDVIKTIDKDLFRINIELVRSYKLRRTPAPFELFEKTLFEEYEKLQIKEGVYVPIYMLKENVCAQLMERSYPFNTFDFEIFFVDLLNKHRSLDRKKILLSQPGKREEEGMYVDNTYYYFISIYDVKEDKI